MSTLKLVSERGRDIYRDRERWREREGGEGGRRGGEGEKRGGKEGPGVRNVNYKSAGK